MSSTIIGILIFIVVALIGFFVSSYLISRLDARPSPEAQRTLELRRVELDLRALEYKSRAHPDQYTDVEREAYAALIRRRNELDPQPAMSTPAPVRRPSVVQSKSRFAGGPVRIV